MFNNLSGVARRPCGLIFNAVWKLKKYISVDIVDLLKCLGWPARFINECCFDDCFCVGVVERELMRECINNEICKFLLLRFKNRNLRFMFALRRRILGSTCNYSGVSVS